MASETRKQSLRKVLIDLAIMAVIGLVLAVVGPFGSFSLPFAWRMVYWVGLSLGGYACYRPIAGWAVDLGVRLELPELAAWIVGCLIATVPMTALVWFVDRIPGPFDPPGLEQALASYGYVLVIGATLTAVFYFAEQRAPLAPRQPKSVAAAALPEAKPGPAAIRFLERIPPRLGTDLLALEMEDHYIRIHTALGSDLILMRLRDAVAELDGIDGLQVHRSWWVSRQAVERSERDGRNLKLVLVGGLAVPVARNLAPVLREASWF